LNIEGMKRFNKGIAKTVTYDFSWSEFLMQIQWKCFKENKHFLTINRWFPSSKLCSNCGQVKEMPLDQRTYTCECGLVLDRDLNAARNIKKEGMNLLKNSTAAHVESYA